MHLVFDVPAASPARRIARALGTGIGVVLVTVSTPAFVPAFWIAFLWVIDTLPPGVEGDPLDFLPEPVRRNLLMSWLACIAFAVVGRRCGLHLVRRNRRLVLFLRRFGHSEATHQLTVAAARIGRSWRLVTLDDARIAPVGINRRLTGAMNRLNTALEVGGELFDIGRAILKAVAVVAGVGLGLSGVAVFLVSDGGVDERLGAVIDLVGWGHSGTGVAAAVFKFFVWVLLLCLAVLLVVLVFGLLAVALMPALVQVGFVEKAIQDAEGLKAITVADVDGIASARARLRKVARRVFSARLIVLKVNGAVWRPAVTDVAADSDVALIDVSQPTEHILWEIDQLRHRQPRPCVFVGEHARVIGLAGADDAVTNRLRELLDGQDVLAYTTDPDGVRRFTRALRGALEQQRRTRNRAGSRRPDRAVHEKVAAVLGPAQVAPVEVGGTEPSGFEHFDVAARGVLVRAERLARLHRGDATTTAHLLLALVDDDNLAVMTLKCLGVAPDTLRREARRLANREPVGPSGDDLGLADDAKAALDLAFQEAVTLRHHHVGPEHLLLGVLREGGAAGAILTTAGVTLGSARQYVAAVVANRHGPQAAGVPPGHLRRARNAVEATGRFTIRHWRHLTQLAVIAAGFAGTLASVTSTVGSCRPLLSGFVIAAGIGAAVGGTLYTVAQGEHLVQEFFMAVGIGTAVAFGACFVLSDGLYNLAQSCLPS